MYLFAGANPCVSNNSCACCALIISARMLIDLKTSKSFSPFAILACSCACIFSRSFFVKKLLFTPYCFSCCIFPFTQLSSKRFIFLNSSGSSTFTQPSSTCCMYGCTSGSFSVLISTASIDRLLHTSSIFVTSLYCWLYKD